MTDPSDDRTREAQGAEGVATFIAGRHAKPDRPGGPPDAPSPGETEPEILGRVLGWSSNLDAFDLVLAGDELWLLRVGRARPASRPTLGPIATVLQWAAALHASVGARRAGTEDGPLAGEHARARLAREALPPSRWLGDDPANRVLRLDGATFRRLPRTGDDEAVQVRGVFASPTDPEGRVEVHRWLATGDPVRDLERLLLRVGIHVG